MEKTICIVALLFIGFTSMVAQGKKFDHNNTTVQVSPFHTFARSKELKALGNLLEKYIHVSPNSHYTIIVKFDYILPQRNLTYSKSKLYKLRPDFGSRILSPDYMIAGKIFQKEHDDVIVWSRIVSRQGVIVASIISNTKVSQTGDFLDNISNEIFKKLSSYQNVRKSLHGISSISPVGLDVLDLELGKNLATTNQKNLYINRIATALLIHKLINTGVSIREQENIAFLRREQSRMEDGARHHLNYSMQHITHQLDGNLIQKSNEISITLNLRRAVDGTAIPFQTNIANADQMEASISNLAKEIAKNLGPR